MIIDKRCNKFSFSNFMYHKTIRIFMITHQSSIFCINTFMFFCTSTRSKEMNAISIDML